MTSTSQELRLAELQKLAKPALADVRLVNLAQDGNVAIKKVVSVAEGLGVSRRQARGTRWLAVLRRDFGLNALEEFVSSMARARAEESATEHAHLEKVMSNERVFKSLELIKDPQKRFELMLNKGMHAEALDYLKELVETKTAFFWYNDGGGLGRVLLDDKRTIVAVPDDINKVVLVCHDDREFSIHSSNELVVSVVGLYDLFGNDAIKPLFVKVIQHAIAIDPRRCGGVARYWNVRGTTVMARIRHHGESVFDEDSLRRAVEVWQTRHHFDDENRLEDLYRYVMPVEERDQHFQLPAKPADQLHWLVDRFTQLGWTQELIQQEFVEWIENHVEPSLPWSYYVAVAAAKCFSLCGHDRAGSALHRCLKRSWERLIDEHPNHMSMAGFKELGRLGMYGREDANFFRAEFSKLLVWGKVGLAARLLLEIGRQTGLCEWGLYEGGSKIKDVIQTTFDSLAPAAFDKAVEEGKFGIAAAIGQHFNCVDEAALHLKANRAFREKLEAVINFENVLDRPKNPEEFWDQVLDGEVSEALEDDPPTFAWYISDEDAPDWMISPLNEEQKTALPQLQQERNDLLKELVHLRKVEIIGAVETAMVLEQPIAFNLITVL